jgi:hypothetical protein
VAKQNRINIISYIDAIFMLTRYHFLRS